MKKNEGTLILIKNIYNSSPVHIKESSCFIFAKLENIVFGCVYLPPTRREEISSDITIIQQLIEFENLVIFADLNKGKLKHQEISWNWNMKFLENEKPTWIARRLGKDISSQLDFFLFWG